MSGRRDLEPEYAHDAGAPPDDPRDGPRAGRARRTLRTDVERLRQRLRVAGGEARRVLEDGVATQPYLTFGAAAGVGFVLGGGVPRGAVALLLGSGARAASRWLGDELLARYAVDETEPGKR